MILKQIITENKSNKKVLTEAPIYDDMGQMIGDDSDPNFTTDQEKITANNAELSSKVKDLLDNNPNLYKNSSYWRDRYSKLSSSEVDEFLDEFINAWTKEKELDVKKIESIKKPFKTELLSLGVNAFDNTTNPMLDFLYEYLRIPSNTLDEDHFIILNNMWSDGTIERKHLKAKVPEKCIIFNRFLWTQPLNEVEFIVKSYFWLEKESNVKRYLNLNNPDLKLKYADGTDVVLDANLSKAVKQFRDCIIYATPNPAMQINDASYIESKLTELQDMAPAAESNSTLTFTDFTEDEVNTILTKGREDFTKDNFQKLFSYAKSKGWIE